MSMNGSCRSEENKKTELLSATAAFLFLLLCLCSPALDAQKKATTKGKGAEDSDLILHLMEKNPAKFKRFLAKGDKYRVQIIYTQIDRDKNNTPSFHEYTYLADPKKYFYCASLVKLPCAALALEKMGATHSAGLSRESRMITDSAASCQKKTIHDSTSATGYPSLAQYIRRMLLVSDNDAYSRCYEYLGMDYIHNKLSEKGYPDAFIVNRFDSHCSPADNAATNPIDFFDAGGILLYHQLDAYCSKPPSHPLGTPKVGKAYLDGDNKKVEEPKDFSKSNFLSLFDVTRMLRSILFPNSVDKQQQFNLEYNDRKFMLSYLSMLPRESDYPHYAEKDYPDSFKKYLMYGGSKKQMQPDSLRIFNVVGQSYGFVSDVAYVCDYNNKIEFMLSAVVYVNENEILNDNKYEYNTLGFPFMAELGKTIYQYDRSRKRKYSPDLSAFKLSK
jgi:hypothetical protein